jgi:hypothetical protein
MGKEKCGTYIYNRKTLFSHKKDWNSVLCKNMDEPGDHYIKWTKLAQKDK